MGPQPNQSNAVPFDPQESQALQLLRELPQQYELLGKISQGGMGAIYKARNRYTKTFFAIKVMRPETAKDEKALLRFYVEAKAASSLRHPHICQVHDFGLTENKMPYLVMDWIDGVSLRHKVERDGKVSAQDAIRIMQQVAQALGHAHQNKIIYRDLKPDNVMLTRDAEGRTIVHLVDFGIAKVLTDEDNEAQSQGLTKTGFVVGTPLFMSPEQAKAAPIDSRTDIYSLGCVIHYALVGKPPFEGLSVIETMTMHLTQEPPEFNPDLRVPIDLKRIVLKCMEKKADDRYQSMEQLGADLKKITKGVGVDRRPLSAERNAARKKLVTVMSFIISFVVMYVISIGVQSLLASHDSHAPSATTGHKQPKQ